LSTAWQIFSQAKVSTFLAPICLGQSGEQDLSDSGGIIRVSMSRLRNRAHDIAQLKERIRELKSVKTTS
jgi:hypothetical protein